MAANGYNFWLEPVSHLQLQKPLVFSAEATIEECIKAMQKRGTGCLIIEDDEGATDSYTQTVSLTALNTEPVASFSTNCIDNHCSFDAGNSYDDDGAITAWSWNLGDGATASGEEITHQYSSAGMYSF